MPSTSTAIASALLSKRLSRAMKGKDEEDTSGFWEISRSAHVTAGVLE